MTAPDAGRPAVSVEEVLAGTHQVWLGDAYGTHPIEVPEVLAEHLAAALADAGIGPIAEARAAALEEAAAEADRESIAAERRGDVQAENVWYACRDWLRGRADREAAQRPEGGA